MTENINGLITSLKRLIDNIDVSTFHETDGKTISVGSSPFDMAMKSLPENDSKNKKTKFLTGEFLEKLSQIEFPGGAIQYSPITQMVYKEGTGTTEGLVIIISNIEKVARESFEEKLESNSDLKRHFYKLIDHLYLASYQTEQILSSSTEKAGAVERKVEKSNQKLSVLNEEIERVTSTIEDFQSKIYTNFITVLGIFTAIVFSMFGGLKLLEFVLLSIDKTPVWKATIFFSMFAIATLSMLFILIRWVSIIVDNITSKERKLNFTRILSSHFGFVFSIIFFLYLIFLGVLFSSESVKVNFQSWIAGFSNYLIMGFILLLPIIIIIILFLTIYYQKNNREI